MHGPLWETDHKAYGKLRKVEPMQRALNELGATALLTGVRSSQTAHRKNMRRVNMQRGSYKLCPVLHWSDEDVHAYFIANNLLYHPLKEQGYESVGDAHSSAPVATDGDVRSSRFGGKHQECGLHVDDDEAIQRTSEPGFRKPGHSIHLNNAKFGKGIEIYSKTSCKSCVAAKSLFRAQKLEYTEYILGVDVDRSILEERVGTLVSSVPQIFIDGQRLGGLAELEMHLGRKATTVPLIPNTGVGLAQAQSAEQWLASIFDHEGDENNGSTPLKPGIGSYVGPAPTSIKEANYALQTFTAESWMRKVFACT